MGKYPKERPHDKTTASLAFQVGSQVSYTELGKIQDWMPKPLRNTLYY